MAETTAPVFVVGANRSGTTLLRLMLNAHSRIAIPEELVYINSFLAGVPVEKWRNPGLPPERYAAFVTRFLEEHCKPLEGLDTARARRVILEEGPADFKRPYQVVLEQWAELQGKQRWGEKTPGNLFYADILLEMFPDARFIHMIRDPRAGVSSMMKAPFFSDDVVFNALAWHKRMTQGRARLEAAVPAARRLTVRYEALVTAPVDTLLAVCAFLEEAYEPEMMRFYENASSFMKPEAASGFNAAATRPVSSSKIDTWKNELDAEEIAIIETVCRREMLEFGYEPENYAPGWQTRLNLLTKTAYSQLQCWRNRRIRHFSVTDRMFARLRGRLQGWTNAVFGRPSARVSSDA